MIKLLIATKNPGKAREMKEFLGNGFEIVSLTDLPDAPDIEENGNTFEENALLKARFYFDWSGISSIADDAGLEIDYLNGEPGVLSRRWPGYEATDEELIEMALKKLEGVPKFNKLYKDLTHEEHEEINHRKVVYGQLAQDIAALNK